MSSHAIKILLPCYLLSIVGIILLAVDFNLRYLVYIILGYILLGVIGNFIGFHRYLTHRSFQVSNIWHRILVSLGSLTGQGSAIFWTALHLHHHRNSDTDLDIHSPIKGFLESSFLWQIRGQFQNVSGLIAPKNLYKDKFVRFIHSHYYKLYWFVGIVFLLINLEFFLFFFIVGGFFMTAIADNISNYCFHSNKFGYKNYDTRDNSRNVFLISILTLGAGWHNNHHWNPSSYRFGVKWWEFDPSAKFIELIKK